MQSFKERKIMADNLIIVESPSKAKTIEKYLGNNYVVKSSFGHIRDLKKSELSIEVENNFLPEYVVPEDKKKVVKDLNDAVKNAKIIWLASDEDREGEAIAWHLSQTLKIGKREVKRIVFNEITKTAILHAVENPRKIDINLVNAQQARRVLDRIVGYEISPVLWKKVKPSLSAGRVQSVAVRLIVERENEIKNFKPAEFFKVSAIFHTKDGQKILKATLDNKFSSEQDAENFLQKCQTARFEIGAIEQKPEKRSPAPPFTTSTLQQEASRKLGFSVSQTMLVAQQLYESGLITYMRTDSVNLSEYALQQAREIIPQMFGEKYLKIRKFSTKTKGAQEAHEAIRPTLLSRTEISGDNYQKRLYDLIWKRMIASQMSDAKIEKTNILINLSNDSNTFSTQAEVILFDGFLKLYQQSKIDDEDEEETSNIIPKISQGEELFMEKCTAKQSFSTKPPRYNEAMLVKKLEDLGIGRPSTYAPTISTIQKREYVEKRSLPPQEREITLLILEKNSIEKQITTENYGKENNKLAPTDIGIVVNAFLVENFQDIMSYDFTAKVEEQFDKIAQGEEDWQKMIEAFYQPFIEEVKNTDKNAQKQRGERFLGVDPKTGRKVYARIGRYGAMVQVGESGTRDENEKPQFASLKPTQSIADITLSEALSLLDPEQPSALGEYEGEEISIRSGRFGSYIKWKDLNVSIPRTTDPMSLDLSACISLIQAKQEKDALAKTLPKVVAELDGSEIILNYGRYGVYNCFYLSYNKKNFRLPKGIEPESLSKEDAIGVVNGTKKATKNTEAMRKFSNGAEVFNGRYGEYIKYNGKNYRMPKGKNSKTLTEEDVNEVIGG